MKQKLYKEKQVLWKGLKIYSHQFRKHIFKFIREAVNMLACAVLIPPSVRLREP